MTDPQGSTPEPAAFASISGHLDTRTAATELAYDLHDAIRPGCDLVVVFASYHHRAALPEAVETIRQTLTPRHSMAVTTEGVLGVDRELEGKVGMAAVALRLPGVKLWPWLSTPQDPIPSPTPVRSPTASISPTSFARR